MGERPIAFTWGFSDRAFMMLGDSSTEQFHGDLLPGASPTKAWISEGYVILLAFIPCSASWKGICRQ